MDPLTCVAAAAKGTAWSCMRAPLLLFESADEVSEKVLASLEIRLRGRGSV